MGKHLLAIMSMSIGTASMFFARPSWPYHEASLAIIVGVVQIAALLAVLRMPYPRRIRSAEKHPWIAAVEERSLGDGVVAVEFDLTAKGKYADIDYIDCDESDRLLVYLSIDTGDKNIPCPVPATLWTRRKLRPIAYYSGRYTVRIVLVISDTWVNRGRYLPAREIVEVQSGHSSLSPCQEN